MVSGHVLMELNEAISYFKTKYEIYGTCDLEKSQAAYKTQY